MATQVEKASGIRTRVKRASRLLSKDPGNGEIPKHRAAVLPAKNKAVKAIPTKAVDEWPEGKDLRPSMMSWIFLYGVSDDFVDIHLGLTRCKCAARHPIGIAQESQGEVDLRSEFRK